MRLFLIFLFLTLITAQVYAKVVESGNLTSTKKILSFTVENNPTPFVVTVIENVKTKKIDSSPQPVSLGEESEKKVKVALSVLAVFLAVIGMWSSLKTMLITIANLGRAGFGLKTIAGVIVFMMSLAMLFYALNLMKESL